MESFSNSYGDLHKELRIELSSLDLKVSEKCIVKYSEIPWFPGGQFSISLVEDNLTHTHRLIEKTWDNDFDLKRFSTGVFNLDRLCIRTRELQLSVQRQKEFQSLIQKILFVPETLERTGYIILDGIEYELSITTSSINKHYDWRLATDDIHYFKQLITFLQTTVRE
jgi:hypothetical protein